MSALSDSFCIKSYNLFCCCSGLHSWQISNGHFVALCNFPQTHLLEDIPMQTLLPNVFRRPFSMATGSESHLVPEMQRVKELNR